MAELNETMTWADVPIADQQSFTRSPAPKLQRLTAGTELYKLTEFPLLGAPNSRITAYWSGVKPLHPNDPGLAGTLMRVSRTVGGGTPKSHLQDFSRARAAVSRHWNAMDKVLRVRLTQSAWGWIGRVGAQRIDDQPANPNVVFIGGAWQVFLPNLTPAHLVQVSLKPV